MKTLAESEQHLAAMTPHPHLRKQLRAIAGTLGVTAALQLLLGAGIALTADDTVGVAIGVFTGVSALPVLAGSYLFRFLAAAVNIIDATLLDVWRKENQ